LGIAVLGQESNCWFYVHFLFFPFLLPTGIMQAVTG